MPFRKWSDAQKAEAVALASVMGADSAADQLGMTADRIRQWAKQAGVDPADTIDAADWADVERVALARTMAMIVDPRAKPSQVATVAAIAKRNADKPRPEAVDSALEAREAFLDWLCERTTDEPALAAVPGELLRRANAEPGQPHRRALLAWFSDRTESNAGEPIVAGDLLEWAKAQVEDIGDLPTWHAKVQAAEHRQRVIRDRRDALRLSGVTFQDAHAIAVELTTDFPDPFEASDAA